MRTISSWRSAGRRAPSLCEASPTDCSSEQSYSERSSPHDESEESAADMQFLSQFSIGGSAIPISKLPSLAAEKKKAKAVAWATPKSLHDTRIITPATHPNRMGQFGSNRARTQSQGFFSFSSFEGAVGTLSQVALIDGEQIKTWLDCTISVVNSDRTYDIIVLASPAADKYNMSDITGYAIAGSYLRTMPESQAAYYTYAARKENEVACDGPFDSDTFEEEDEGYVSACEVARS
ncbi:hypothetical protein DIPPA_06561 [Diplonema papillatum]|nr:hypothetical protein DIPPA_06561 [Diplonema papillatum]